MERMRHSASLIIFLALVSLRAYSANSPVLHIKGHYTDQQLAEVRILILPRVFLYDAKNHLVPDEQWPLELADVVKHKGDGRCCLSYVKNTTGGPPPECAKPLFGDEGVNWESLTDENGAKIDLQKAPPHRWLIVEFSATWCAPCVAQEKLLDKVFASTKKTSDYEWLTVDMTRITHVKDVLKKANTT
jgi:hypothetical protein